MTCPRCEIGTIGQVTFKKNNEKGYLCDYCGSLWFKEEEIESHTGHTIRSYSQGEDLDFTYSDEEETDQEHRPARFPKLM